MNILFINVGLAVEWACVPVMDTVLVFIGGLCSGARLYKEMKICTYLFTFFTDVC